LHLFKYLKTDRLANAHCHAANIICLSLKLVISQQAKIHLQLVIIVFGFTIISLSLFSFIILEQNLVLGIYQTSIKHQSTNNSFILFIFLSSKIIFVKNLSPSKDFILIQNIILILEFLLTSSTKILSALQDDEHSKI
jgi:hypothetical protein